MTKDTKSSQKSERARTNRTGKGEDADADRNAQGVAITKKEYVVGTAKPEDRVEGDVFYAFKLEQWRFLEEYAKDLDPQRAAAALQIPARTVKRWLTEEKFQEEIKVLQSVWRENLKMTAEHAAAKHIKLMEKMERDYDRAESVSEAAKMAGPLSKMSDSYLKASGHYDRDGGGSDAQVVINIDLGDSGKDVNISGGKRKRTEGVIIETGELDES